MILIDIRGTVPWYKQQPTTLGMTPTTLGTTTHHPGYDHPYHWELHQEHRVGVFSLSLYVAMESFAQNEFTQPFTG